MVVDVGRRTWSRRYGAGGRPSESVWAPAWPPRCTPRRCNRSWCHLLAVGSREGEREWVRETERVGRSVAKKTLHNKQLHPLTQILFPAWYSHWPFRRSSVANISTSFSDFSFLPEHKTGNINQPPLPLFEYLQSPAHTRLLADQKVVKNPVDYRGEKKTSYQKLQRGWAVPVVFLLSWFHRWRFLRQGSSCSGAAKSQGRL